MFVWVRKLDRDARFANRDVCYCAVTRFNVRMKSLQSVRGLHDRGEYDGWIVARAEAMRRLCVPSLVTQAPRPHAWFVLFDTEITEPVSALLDDILDGEYVVPLFLGPDWPFALPGEIAQVVRGRFPWARYVAATHVDSDDALHRRFHGVVDAALAQLRRDGWDGGRVALDLQFGAARDDEGLTVKLLESSFFSLVEPIDSGMRGPYAVNHRHIATVATVVPVLTERPMWVYQLHGHNLSRGAERRGFPAFAEQDEILVEMGLDGRRVGNDE